MSRSYNWGGGEIGERRIGGRGGREYDGGNNTSNSIKKNLDNDYLTYFYELHILSNSCEKDLV